MIYEIALEVEARMRDRKYPYRVQYGPEFASRDGNGSNGIVVLRSARPDAFAPADARNANPQYRAVRTCAVDAWVYARSSKPGASRHDHEFDCEAAVDLFTCALYDTIKVRREGVVFVGGSYLTPDELAMTNLTTWNGVVYVMQFGIQRGVVAKDYTGDARPEGAFGSATNTTAVFALGHEDGTACDTAEG